MPAYVVALIDVSDPDRYPEYTARVPATIERFGGRFVARGGTSETLEGAVEAGRVVIVEFPSYEQAKEWYESDEYRPLIDLRQSASEGSLLLVDGV